MTQLSNIARPYARAAFCYAMAHKQLANWQKFLQEAATLTTHPNITRNLSNPKISTTAWFDFYMDFLGNKVDEGQKNFLRLLASNQRLMLLPAITDLFAEACAEEKEVQNVRVVSAIDMQEAEKESLERALKQRLNQQVVLECRTDPSLLGGAIIHIGDRVIDGSIRGQLARLLEFSLR